MGEGGLLFDGALLPLGQEAPRCLMQPNHAQVEEEEEGERRARRQRDRKVCRPGFGEVTEMSPLSAASCHHMCCLTPVKYDGALQYRCERSKQTDSMQNGKDKEHAYCNSLNKIEILH